MSQFEVREVEGASAETLCALFARVFNHPIEPSAWRWKYHDPSLQGCVNVVLEQAGAIVGHAGAVILPGVLHGHPVSIAQVCDVMLAPELRGGAGPSGAYATFMNGFIASMQRRLPDGMYYGFPGTRPFRLGERLGFYRGTGPIIAHSCLAAMRRLSAWRLVPLAWDDVRVDRLWSDVGNQRECGLVRDRRFLDWRYARNPLRTYRLIGVRGGLRLRGWVVVSPSPDGLLVVDQLLPKGLFDVALPAILNWAAVHGHARVTWWPGSPTDRPPAEAQTYSNGMVGVVMPSSASAFAHIAPCWQPGDSDVY